MAKPCVLFSPVRYKLEWSRWMGTKEATQWCDWGEKKSLGECQCTVRVEYAKTLQNTYCDFNDLWETSLLLPDSSSKRLTSPACWESQELNINYIKWMSSVYKGIATVIFFFIQVWKNSFKQQIEEVKKFEILTKNRGKYPATFSVSCKTGNFILLLQAKIKDKKGVHPGGPIAPTWDRSK